MGYDQYGSPPVDLADPSRVIAIIDTGIDLDHLEFGGPAGTEGSKIHGDSRSFLQDGASSGVLWLCDCDTDLFAPQPPEDTAVLAGLAPHGTFIAGMAAAYANGDGMAGICWDCGVLVLRVMSYSSADPCENERLGEQLGTACWQTAQTMSNAIKFAAGGDETIQQYLPQPRARIISISAESQGGYSGLGCAGHPIADAIDEAVMQGGIIVAIAGNRT
ncbi:MAG: S8/S53 family peptidase [Phycisphaerales bacterium]|nr:S8/S53 family peptidase [Phycisphaerales bacterium]